VAYLQLQPTGNETDGSRGKAPSVTNDDTTRPDHHNNSVNDYVAVTPFSGGP